MFPGGQTPSIGNHCARGQLSPEVYTGFLDLVGTRLVSSPDCPNKKRSTERESDLPKVTQHHLSGLLASAF